MNARRRFANVLLALALLFGQTAAFAHVLSHFDAHDPEHAPAPACELCVGQHALGAGLPSATLAVLPTVAAYALFAPPQTTNPQTAALRPCARAPPSRPR